VKVTGLAEYSDSRDLYVEQESTHVKVAVEATSGARSGETLLTPGQARLVAHELIRVADCAEQDAEAETL